MRVIGGNFSAAQFATLHIALARADELAKSSECVFVS
jgi:hypothetical protein